VAIKTKTFSKEKFKRKNRHTSCAGFKLEPCTQKKGGEEKVKVK